MLNKTSIIILSYNTLELTQLCIDSIRRHTAPELYELIVVDNGSTDGSAEWLAEQPELLLIANGENRGFPAGCNEGARLASGDSLLLLNSDTVVTESWLENLRTALFSADNIGAVGCVTNNCANGQKIDTHYSTLQEMEEWAASFNVSNPAKWHPYMTLVGFCLLIRRTAYADVGELDEALSPGNFEDDDICLRLRAAGYETLLCEDVFIHHFGSASFKKLGAAEKLAAKEKYERLLAKNFAYMCAKWGFDEGYKFVHSFFTEKIGERLQPGARLTLVGCDYRREPFIMKKNYPGLEMRGVAFTERGARIARTTYPVEQVASITDAPAAIRPAQDIIIVLGELLPAESGEHIITELMERLAPGGVLYYEQGDRVYERHQPPAEVHVNERAPLVSIMIPTYNMPEIFARTMASAAAQDYPNVEIIVADNSTNSDTATIMERYRDDSRVRYYRNTWAHSKEDNFVPFEQLARGEYLQWLMHDDILLPQKVRKMAEVLRDCPGVTLVSSRRGFIDGNDNIIPSPFDFEVPIEEDNKIFVGASAGFVTLVELANFIGEPSVVLFRRQDLKNHYWHADCRGYLAISDVAMWLELLEKGDLAMFRDPLSYFRLHSAQEGQRPDVVINSRLEWYRLVTEYYERGVFIKNPKDYVQGFKKFVYEYDNVAGWKNRVMECPEDLGTAYIYMIAHVKELIARYDH